MAHAQDALPVASALTRLAGSAALAGLALGWGALGWGVTAGAQEQGETGSFFETVDVDVVNVEVFVTDKKGHSVTGLGAEDFRLSVDGRPVEISNFYAEVLGRPAEEAFEPSAAAPQTAPAAAPEDQRLHVIVVVNNAQIRPANRKRVFKALRGFMADGLNADDVVSVVSVNQTVFVHSDFLSDRRTLGRILDEVENTVAEDNRNYFERRRIFSELFEGGTTQNDPGLNLTSPLLQSDMLTRIRAYAEEEYHRTRANLSALGGFADSLGGIPGRKALILVSDSLVNNPGEDLYTAYNEKFGDIQRQGEYQIQIGHFDLMQQFRELGRRANAARATLYAIDGDSDYGSPRLSAEVEGRSIGEQGSFGTETLTVIDQTHREPLELIATTTGGKRFQAAPRLEQYLSDIASDFGTYYSLGFRAPEAERGRDHRIDVEVTRPGLVVRHRETFERKSRDQRMAGSTLAALLFNAVDNVLGVELEPGPAEKRDDGNSLLPVHVRIPVESLVMLPRGGLHTAQLSFYVSVKDEAGDPRPVQKLPFQLNVPEDKVEEARGDFARYTLPLVVHPGDQQVAIAIRDDIAAVSSTLRLQLPSRR